MALLGNHRAGTRSAWRGVLVVLAICALTFHVATRYSLLSSEAPSVKTVKAVKSQSPEFKNQRLLNDGASWISPVLHSLLLQPPRSSVRAISAVVPAIHLVAESWLYNRPPPSC
jgi:hypothetical protein